MNGLGHTLLADTALPQDKHVAFGTAHLVDEEYTVCIPLELPTMVSCRTRLQLVLKARFSSLIFSSSSRRAGEGGRPGRWWKR
jgi:hypothetical protein